MKNPYMSMWLSAVNAARPDQTPPRLLKRALRLAFAQRRPVHAILAD